MIHRLYRDDGIAFHSPDRGGVLAAAVGDAENVNDTRARQHPGIRPVEGHAAGVAPGPDPGLAQIVPTRPHEVAHEVGVLLHHLPVLPDVLREGLAA